jgi:malate dehydrogenase (oxaloacetate-decarboxylating)(NADP+)
MVEQESSTQKNFADEEALSYHSGFGGPGKYTVKCIKPMHNQKDLSLAYSPGVAIPCLEIAKDPEAAYKYTNKGNMVAVVSNGTAVLGLGNLGALASKPVMEGKAVLFNKFAGVESIDLCIDAKTPEEIIACVKCLGPSFAGINLEDFKAPDCFIIETELKKMMDIPIFHDD